MLSLKRLLYIIAAVVFVSAIFIIYNLNEQYVANIDIVKQTDAPAQLIQNIEFTSAKTQIYVTGKSDKEPYSLIYDNVIKILSDLKINFVEMEHVDQLPSDDVTIIFCGETLSSYVDLVELGDFIKNGGNIILASGITEGVTDTYFDPFLGITEKSIKESYSEFKFIKPIFPLQPSEMSYSGYNVSTWINLRDAAEIYVEDAQEQMPILYTFEYEQGKTLVINATFLDNYSMCGVLVGAISLLKEDFIYPVIGHKVVFLDNFPMVTYIDDKQSIEMYGKTTESFVRDVIWPNFQGLSLRTNTRFSSGVMVEASEPSAFPAINDELFISIGKSALQHSGELLFSANCTDEDEIYVNQQFIDKFNAVYTNYDISGLTIQNNVFNEGMLNLIEDDIYAVRKNIENNNTFEYNEDYFVFPGVTSGNDMESGTLFDICSFLTTYGMISHTFDINLLIAENSTTPSWETDKKQIAFFETEVLANTEYLEPKTLSNTRNAVMSYTSLDYSYERVGDMVTLNCNNFMIDQAFYFYTNDNIKSIVGGTFETVGNGYYLLRVQTGNITIELGE